MARDPRRIALAVAKFLDLPESSGSRFSDSLHVEQPERTATNFGQPLSVDTVLWSTDQRKQFEEICIGEMLAFGYSTDQQYFIMVT